MTNEEIQKHIETNCRNEHGESMMDEQAFYEGAKWARDQMNSSNDIQNVGDQRELLINFIKWWGENRAQYDNPEYEDVDEFINQ